MALLPNHANMQLSRLTHQEHLKTQNFEQSCKSMAQRSEAQTFLDLVFFQLFPDRPLIIRNAENS